MTSSGQQVRGRIRAMRNRPCVVLQTDTSRQLSAHDTKQLIVNSDNIEIRYSYIFRLFFNYYGVPAKITSQICLTGSSDRCPPVSTTPTQIYQQANATKRHQTQKPFLNASSSPWTASPNHAPKERNPLPPIPRLTPRPRPINLDL